MLYYLSLLTHTDQLEFFRLLDDSDVRAAVGLSSTLKVSADGL